MMFRHESVRKLYPDVITTVDNKSYDSSGNLVIVDEDLVLKENAKLQAEYDAEAYSRNRQAEYPSVQECVHAILDDDLVALQEKRQAVKTKYPKS